MDKKDTKELNMKRYEKENIKILNYEFECIVDVQNHEFGWVRFQNPIFLIIK